MTQQTNPYAAPTTLSEPSLDPSLELVGQFRTAALGLKLIYAGLLIVLATWIAAIPLAIFLDAGSGWINILLGVAGVIGALLVNAGPLMCVTVPRGLGLRPFAIVAVALQFMTITIFVLTMVAAALTTVLLAAAMVFLMFATASAFLLFLYRLSQCIGRPDLTRRARNVGIFSAVFLFGFFPVSTLVESNQSTNSVVIGSIAYTFAGVVLFVAYANVVNAIGDAIRRPGIKKRPVGIA